MARKKVTARVLRADLKVTELGMELGLVGAMTLAEGTSKDGSKIVVSASLTTKRLVVERSGHYTRYVELQDLVDAMVDAIG